MRRSNKSIKNPPCDNNGRRDYTWNYSSSSLLNLGKLLPQREIMLTHVERAHRQVAGERYFPVTFEFCGLLRAVKAGEFDWWTSGMVGEKPGQTVSWITRSWLLSITQTDWNKELWQFELPFRARIVFFFFFTDPESVDAGARHFLHLTSCVKSDCNLVLRCLYVQHVHCAVR